MKEIFVTVGTTPFRRLIEEVRSFERHFPGFEFYYQIGRENVGELDERVFSMLPRDEYVERVLRASVIVAHAGAGTVFSLLEMRKRLVVVPNLHRVDKHQNDLAWWLCENKLAFVSEDLSSLKSVLCDAVFGDQELAVYAPDMFFVQDDLAGLINESFEGRQR